ncbi:hypothetical protein FisN_27Hu027 [Fistulifera solaris]|uniref:Uncharacterized protein n=1 Tax=Fistulifera solaris TaxID=1519565 RepID=A0A1Z5KQ58_FISSO|nr:hypothetical protein FisN_27Hu027 [Fistulifera solaris]|eukprot:GAX28317.1 hypothetical protein FisN_27Hu027 [Fistulifera solaris]
MDVLVVGQITFWYTVCEISPTAVVDKLIQFLVDLTVPGRGAGESTWLQRQVRTLEQTTERASLEFQIRRFLRAWDYHFPEIHHELIVRYVTGALVSIAATSLYHSFRRPSRPPLAYR